MPFDTALSGIRAASTELSVTGNNIANASTTGFKGSRVEFGDVYAISVLGAGTTIAGSGVQIQDIAQNFSQGNVTFTENELDMAINGTGFFILNRDGETLYTRAGSFGLDADGFVVNNVGARLQGSIADENGNLGGIPTDIRIQRTDLNPRQTTLVSSRLNLDATQDVLQRTGMGFDNSTGVVVGAAESGLTTATTSTLSGGNFTVTPATPLAIDFSTTDITFDVEVQNASTGNDVVSVTLNTANGVPATIDSKRDLEVMVASINEQLLSNVPSVSAVARLIDNGGGSYSIDFTALQSGESSIISFTPTSGNEALLALDAGSLSTITGEPSVSNGYLSDALSITDPNGTTTTFVSEAGASAAETAAELNAIEGLTATAETIVNMDISLLIGSPGSLDITINGVTMTVANETDLGTEINSRTATTLPGISATIDENTGNLIINSASGEDIRIAIAGGGDGDSITVYGTDSSSPEVLEIETGGGLTIPSAEDASTNSVVVGGVISIIVDENYSVANAPSSEGGLGGAGIFPLINDAPGSGFFAEETINAFDPSDQSTYNSATSMTIYDSFGVAHVMTQYFVKEGYDPSMPVSTTNAPNQWTMYVQIDGRDIGNPVPPSVEPTRQSFTLRFNEDGSLDEGNTPIMQITNWVPMDDSGNPNGSLSSDNNGTLPIPNPPTSSNFVIDLEGTTQFGSAFSVRDIDQNGYATGQLSGLTVDDEGVIFARFTNGESLVLAQVELADFSNENGLQPMGNTMWAETFDSGEPVYNAPGIGALGTIQAGALEESNVDLSEQLVALIIAQRNFQASAKTIETADQVTQTVINLR